MKNTIIKRFGELEKGDIIFQYGVLFRLVDVWMYERDDGKIVVRFKTEPYNQATVEMVGQTAAYGTYGGISTLEMTCYIKDDYKFVKGHMSSMYGTIAKKKK